MSRELQKVIYILGLGHSGSTILDMLLTTAGKAIGLGQVWNVLREDVSTTKTRVCSCGAPAAVDCEFWGPVIGRIERLPIGASVGERYRLVLEAVERLYGPDMAVVDSSKLVESLRILADQVPSAKLTVIHNIKDVRAFSISILDNNLRKGRAPELPEKIFFQWYRDNRRSYAAAERLLRREPVRVMYESLCLATESVVAGLEKLLGDKYIDLSVGLGSGNTHIISGNRSRLPRKTNGLAYDYRWMERSEWLRPYLLLPMVRRYNEQCLRESGARCTVSYALKMQA